MTVRKFSCLSVSLLLTISCGAGAPEPTTPAEPKEEPAAVEEAPQPVEPEIDPNEPPGPTGNRTPKDIVTSENSRFVLNFNSSDAGIKAGERCDRQYGSDPRKRNQCMKTARSKVREDVMQFDENAAGKWVWTVSNQRGSSLRHLRQVNFTWGEETKNSIEIIPSRGSKVVLGVPNNYSIVIENPTHGKLVYDSKID